MNQQITDRMVLLSRKLVEALGADSEIQRLQKELVDAQHRRDELAGEIGPELFKAVQDRACELEDNDYTRLKISKAITQ